MRYITSMTILPQQQQQHRHEAVPVSENDDDADDEPDGILNYTYGPLGTPPRLLGSSNTITNANSSPPVLYQYVPPCLKFQDRDHHDDDDGDRPPADSTTDTSSSTGVVAAEQQQQDLNLEATALAVSCYGRACLGMASLFLGPALLELAGRAAGCPAAAAAAAEGAEEGGDDDNTTAEAEAECTRTIHGFRPSSLLTNLAAASGLLGALLLPYAGSLVDHTPHRRQVGAISGLLCVLVKGLEAGVSQRTWVLVALGQVVTAVLFSVHIVAHYAYVSELGRGAQRQARYNATFSVTVYVATLLFLVPVLGVSAAFRLGDVGTARVSQVLTALTCGPTMYLAWVRWLPDRPAARAVPLGRTLWSAGFHQLGRTLRQLWQRQQQRQHALLYLLCSVACGEAASSALVSVSTTYMKNVLRMDANQIGLVFLVVLLGGIPGAKLGKAATALLQSPVRSVVLCNVGFAASTGLAAVVLNGPEDQGMIYIFGVLWGCCLGWQMPMHTAAFVPLMAPGQETELMGLYILAGQILSWLPPAVFTVLNEFGFPMSYGLASQCVFFCLALLFLVLMGDYDRAVAAAGSQPVPTTTTTTKSALGALTAVTGDGDFELMVPPASRPSFTGDQQEFKQRNNSNGSFRVHTTTPLDENGGHSLT